MIPPVEVPAMTSTIVVIARPVRRSISASTSAGISPRMPPPSTASAFTGSAYGCRGPGGAIPRAAGPRHLLIFNEAPDTETPWYFASPGQEIAIFQVPLASLKEEVAVLDVGGRRPAAP